VSVPILVPTKPGFGVGTFEANNAFTGLAGMRWSWETGLGQMFNTVDGIVIPLFPNLDPGTKLFGAAGDATLGNITQGMTNTQHAHASHLVQHAYVLNGLGAAVAQGAADTLTTRKAVTQKTKPSVITKIVRMPIRVNLRPLQRAVASDGKRLHALERENAEMRARVKRLEKKLQNVGVMGGTWPGNLGGEMERIRRGIDRLGRKVNKGLGLAAFIALLIKALEKTGGNYIRCSNSKAYGKSICSMNRNLLESLLKDALLFSALVSVVEFAKELQGIETEVVKGIRLGIKELKPGFKPVAGKMH